jgi:hypothetical protein
MATTATSATAAQSVFFIFCLLMWA